jgi:hypothetical protein
VTEPRNLLVQSLAEGQKEKGQKHDDTDRDQKVRNVHQHVIDKAASADATSGWDSPSGRVSGPGKR